jgi:signal transduction histidine kinase
MYVALNQLTSVGAAATGSFLVLAVFLANRYGFLQKNVVPKAVALAALLAASIAISARLYGLTLGGIVTTVVFVGVYIILWFIAAEEEIRDLFRRYQATVTRLQQNKKHIDAGRSALGMVHAMSGRLIALDRAVELLETGQSMEIALAKLKTAKKDIGDMLANLKQSVVHQADLETSDIRVSEVLRGLVEMVRAEKDGASGPGGVNLDVKDDMELHSSPAEVYAMFEGVVRNAVESGASTVNVTVGPGRTVTVSDNGPGIPFCVACKKPDCMNCKEFREGKTTKPDGSGIGMVIARELVEPHGTLRVRSEPGNTQIQFKFQEEDVARAV